MILVINLYYMYIKYLDFKCITWLFPPKLIQFKKYENSSSSELLGNNSLLKKIKSRAWSASDLYSYN